MKSDVAALERKIQLELASPKPEAAQEQRTDSGTIQTQSPPTGERAIKEPPSDMSNQSQFVREHVRSSSDRKPPLKCREKDLRFNDLKIIGAV